MRIVGGPTTLLDFFYWLGWYTERSEEEIYKKKDLTFCTDNTSFLNTMSFLPFQIA